MIRKSAGLFLLAFVFLGVGVCIVRCEEAKTADEINAAGRSPRPAEWAQPIEKPGLPNFFKVSDNLYRGAQPTAEGFRELEKMGVKTVVNLRSFHSDRDELEGTALGYVHVWAKAWNAEDEDVVKFLKVVADKSKAPVFVHCQHGADRTGMMVAIYRIIIQGWTKGAAVKEMTEGGFGHHKIWANLVDYVRELDVEDIKKQAGLTGERKAVAPAGADAPTE
ncbi:MAG: fused DSP-PTPase phosphatase/NAD kinase-like protein [Planctomycetota bacterium]|jgi:protein tyrosine/serine phosphatase